jgi:hypothetical protein
MDECEICGAPVAENEREYHERMLGAFLTMDQVNALIAVYAGLTCGNTATAAQLVGLCGRCLTRLMAEAV